MSSVKLLIYALLSEQTALLALSGHQPIWYQALFFLAAHALASALFAMLLTGVFPRSLKPMRSGLLALFFCFAFFVPVLGAVAIIITMIYFTKFRYKGERDEFFSVPLPPFLQEATTMAAGMGEGGAWTRLRTTGLPRQERLKALMAVGTGSGFNTSSFLQLATGDSDDEIRLLAFNLCERNEQKVNQAITTALTGLKSAETPAERADFCRALAFSYWELVYNSLAQDELKNFFIEQSLKYARQAMELGSSNPALLILFGRIHLLRNEHALAGESIRQAMGNGASPSQVIPYLAELAFLKRDFAAVKNILAQDPSLRFKPGIGPVARFWRT